MLGTQEVTVLDMASAYGTFAAGGVKVDPVFVTQIVGPSGETLYEHTPAYSRVYDTSVVEQVTATLTEGTRRGTGQQARIGRPVAGKTGSTESNHDAWFAGYTPELSAVVWVGYAEGNTPLTSPHTPYTITGGAWPAQIWSRFAAAALSGTAYTPAPEATSEALVTVRLDTSTGFLAGPLCPRAHVATVQLQPAIVPSIVCPIHNPAGIAARADGTVPDVGSLSVVDAVSLLEASGYVITLTWGTETAYLPGTVLGQFPSAGTPLAQGTAVEVIVAGPEPGTAVPDTIGSHRAEAIARLAAVGLDVNVIPLEDPDGISGGLQVWAQVPGPGEPVPQGRVTIWVSP